MKKTLAIILSMTMVLLLFAGCSQSNQSENNTSTVLESSSTDSENIQSTNDTLNDTSDTSNILVVYYSAQEHTKGVSEIIANTLGADTFIITPVEPYTEDDLDWTDDNSRVVKEHEDENRHVELVSTTVENWDSYDTILIGYPIWWGEAAWVVDDFVKNNDFTGKTVIPFCTSTSSGIGESGKLLAQMASSGNWIEGKRFSERYSEDDVVSWISTLGIE